MTTTKHPHRTIQKVQIHIDGRDWPIEVTHNLLIDCEELTGLNVLTGEANIVRPSAKLIRALTYLALKKAGANYTLDQVGDLIGPHNMAEVLQGLLNAWGGPVEETPGGAA